MAILLNGWIWPEGELALEWVCVRALSAELACIYRSDMIFNNF